MAVEPVCYTCNDSGIERYTCGEGTCDLTDWCNQCGLGPLAKAEWEETLRVHRLNRMAEAGVFDCPCKPCREARGD